MFEWLRRRPAAAPDRLSNRRVLVRPARVVRGRYDAAQTTGDNERHWANADFLAADAANSPEVRRALRCRARYEVANNSYAKGIVLTLANDVVGTGPRLQMLARDPAVSGRRSACAYPMDAPGRGCRGQRSSTEGARWCRPCGWVSSCLGWGRGITA